MEKESEISPTSPDPNGWRVRDDAMDRPASPVIPGAGSRIVIQGVPGAFHEIAARKFFGPDIEIIPALSFAELFEKAADPDQTDAAILAIENSIVGSILGNYKLLLNSDLTILGEVHLRIRQNLLVLPGVELADLREVHSHPMALAQCTAFFKVWPHIRLVESDDTAESAAHIARQGLKQVGAVASILAAESYGLQVLVPAIETVPENYTRFLALGRKSDDNTVPQFNKTSLCFTTSHEPGSLAGALSLLANEGANLTKIQSVPIIGKPWEYRFFADFTVATPSLLPEIIHRLKTKTTDLKVLGIYMEGSTSAL